MRDGNLRQLFRQHLPAVDFVSVETGGTGRGIPDSEYCYEGRTGWIEFKMAKGQNTGIRPEQFAWMNRRIRHGGRAFVAIRRKFLKKDLLFFMPGDCASHKLKDCACPNPMEGGPRGWDWDKILIWMTE